MSNLDVQERRSVVVDPAVKFFPTGIEVAPGQRYRFVATGKWKDGRLRPCGPGGWWGGPFQKLNRLPGKRFFLLCGTVGEDDTNAFAIGAQGEWTVPTAVAERADCRLVLFANDWPSRYDNNHVVPPEQGGPLSVLIARLA